MIFQFSSFIRLFAFSATFGAAAPIPRLSTVEVAPLAKRVDALGAGDIITCGTGAKLVTHDCDVAFLNLGGGIAGAIEFLRVNADITTGTSGSCTFTAQAINGGTIIDASKGRLEQGQEPLIAHCGPVAGSTVLVVGGAKSASGAAVGDILLTISAS